MPPDESEITKEGTTDESQVQSAERESEGGNDVGGESFAERARRAFKLGKSEKEGSTDGEEAQMSETSADLDTEEMPQASSATEESEALQAVRAESKENYDKYLRCAADLDNFKKRTAKERSDLIRYAGEGLALDMLEVVDNLERAIAQEASQANADELLKGVRLIYERFVSLLDRHGIKSQESVGQEFNPALHEALATVPTNAQPPNTVIEQYRKAFYFKDKLLRPAQVVV